MTEQVTGPESLFAVTFFDSAAASKKVEGHWSLVGLARRIKNTGAPEKNSLPWLKLATFGDKKTPLVPSANGSGRMTGGSLRHDANLLTITGIEADYDAEQVSFDEAVERLIAQGILGIVYTSPSHTEKRQRWRVLCPLSVPVAPEMRGKMLGRLNGLFHGIFAGESWALSQSYYFGSVGLSQSHRVKVIDGTPIDEHDDLDVTWTGKPNTDMPVPGRAGTSGPANESELLQQIISGGNYHAASLRLLGIWARAGVAFMDARRRLVDAMQAVPEAERGSRWQMRRDDIDRSLDYVYGKEARKQDEGVAGLRGQREKLDYDGDLRPSGFTDEGLALRFTDQHRSILRYVAGWGRWMQWDGIV